MSKNKFREFADKVLDSLQRRHEKTLSASKKEFKYNEWVLEKLDLAYEYAFRSLEDEEISENLVIRASELFPTLHFENLKNNQEQETNFNDKIRSKIRAALQQALNEKSIVPRKDKSIQKFYPAKEAAFQYLVKQIVSATEKEQEKSGLSISADAALFRFYGKLNDNNISIQPTAKSLPGLFGILYDMPSNLLVSMNSLLRNIDINADTENPYYHDKKYFDTSSLEIALNQYRRFQETDFFETAPINAQEYHKDIKKSLAKYSDDWFRFKPANEEEIEYIDNILERHITWGVTPLLAERLPKYDFRYTPIEHFILNDEHLGDIHAIRDNEQKLRASLLSREFRKVFLSNKSMELKNMKVNMLMPVVKGDNPEGRMTWKEVKPLDPNVKYEIATKALSRPMTFQQLQEFFYLSVEVDGIEIATADSDSGRLENIIIPPDGKILSVWAKAMNNRFSENSMPLASLFLDFTSVMKGMEWSSESVLENGKHIGIHLIPVKDSENQVTSMSLTVAYHGAEECTVSSHKISLTSRFRRWIRDNFTEIVPVRIESFLSDIQPLGLYSEPQTNQRIFKHSLGFTVSMLLLVLGVNLLSIFDKFDFIAASTITAIEIILIVFSNMILQKLARKKGINYSFRLSHQYGFLAGVVTLLTITMIFNPIGENISLKKNDNGFDGTNNHTQTAASTYENYGIFSSANFVLLTNLSKSKVGDSEEQTPPIIIGTYKVTVSTGWGKNIYRTKVKQLPNVANGTKVNAVLFRKSSEDKLNNVEGNPLSQEGTIMTAIIWSKLNELEINFKQNNIQFNRNDIMLIYFEKLEESQSGENNKLNAEIKSMDQDSIDEMLTVKPTSTNSNSSPSKADEKFADNSLPKQAIATH